MVDLLRKHKLNAKLSKCEFEQAELQFLGFVISGDSVKMDPKKTAVVKDWPVPKDVGQLRSFLGMANYFKSCNTLQKQFCATHTNLVVCHPDGAASMRKCCRKTGGKVMTSD